MPIVLGGVVSLEVDERETLTSGRKSADMVLSRMHGDEKEFYADLLKAKIQYMRTRQYWDDK